MPVDASSKFGLIFIFDDLYATRPRHYIHTLSLCPETLQVKESFAAPEDHKWCVVMTLRDGYPHEGAWGPQLAF